MKMKRLLLLLSLIVTAGSAAWADIANGSCKNGTWVIDNSGKLTVNINGKMADYGEGKAPWYGYAEQIKGIHIGSGCKNIGRNGFYGLTKVEQVTGGENVEACAMYSFEECGVGKLIPEIYLPKCTYVGECAFRGCGAQRIVLPVVEEVRTRAFAGSPYLTQIDLGSKIEEIGVLAFSECPQMWVDNTPNIFMSNPTPPKLYTKLEGSTAEKIKNFFKNFGIGIGIAAASLIPGGCILGYMVGNTQTYNAIQDDLRSGLLTVDQYGTLWVDGFEHSANCYYEKPYNVGVFSELGGEDKWYNPFAPKPDGTGWTDGEPIICVPANLVKAYRDYYFDAENMKEGNWGYIDDDAEGMNVSGYRDLAAHGAIMAGGKLGTTFDQGFWLIGQRNSKNELSVIPDAMEGWTEDALIIGGDMKDIGMSAVNGLKSKVKALYITSNSTFPEGAFQGWTNLEYATMARGSWISDRMFKGCTNLEIIDTDAQSIGLSAFEGCTKLKYFRGSDNIKNVATKAFMGCTNLWDVTLPRVKYIQDKAFMGCSNLHRVISSGLSSENLQYTYDIESIGESAFEGCESLYDISFQNLQQLGKRAFYGCSSLFEFTSGPYFSTVPEEAFANSGIKRIMQNGTAYSFESKSFDGCTMLTNTTYTSSDRGIFDSRVGSISTVASDAFGSLELKNIPLHCVPEAWARSYQKDPVLGKMQYMDYDVEYNWTVEKNGWELTQSGILTVGSNFNGLYNSKIEDYPWYPYIDRIKKVLIDDGTTRIYKSMFAGMTRVTDIHIPRTVKIIDESAFKGCRDLKNIYIYSVENIGNYAFEDCSSLGTVELGENLKNAGDYIFRNCSSLNYIANMTSTPAKVTDLTFKDIKSGAYAARGDQAMRAPSDGGQSMVTLKVNDANVTKYMTDKHWSKFHIAYADGRGEWYKAGEYGDGMWILYTDGTMLIAADKGPKNDYIDFPYDVLLKTKALEVTGNITRLGYGFYDFANLESVKLSDKVRVLDETFMDCSKLSSINIQNVDTIGEWTFSGTALTSLDLSHVKLIDEKAFYGCKQLNTVRLGDQCEVKRSAFNGCINLKAIDLGGADLNEASGCFNSCKSLEMVSYNGRKLPYAIFANCTALKSVMLGENVDTIIYSAFMECTALDTIYCERATPPALPVGQMQDIIGYEGGGDVAILGDPYDVWAFHKLDKAKINLVVAPDYIPLYRKTDIWKEMTIMGDSDYPEPSLPVGGTIGENGSWAIDANGVLTIDYDGNIFSKMDGMTWRDRFGQYLPFITKVVTTDPLKTLPTNMVGTHEPLLSENVKEVELGARMQHLCDSSLNYSGLTDVYCYAITCPLVANGAFDWDALTQNNATLHVVNIPGIADNYRKSKTWSKFPNIVGDLESRLPAGMFRSESKEGLYVWYRITDEEAKTCETYPRDIDNGDRAVEMNPYSSYAMLTIPETVEYNGTTYTVTGIGDQSFAGCSNFDNFTLPSTIESIGVSAFEPLNGMHITDFTLPANLKYIADNAFEMWVNLQRLTVMGKEPPAVGNNAIGMYWDPDLAPHPILLVPGGCKDAWNIAPWNEWFTIIDKENPNTLTYKIKPGANFWDNRKNDEEYMCVEALQRVGELTYENEVVDKVWDEMSEDWEDVYADAYYNKAGKKLFYLEDGQYIHLFDDVTPADNIYYEFKDDDYDEMAYTAGENVRLFKAAAIIFPENTVQSDVYFSEANEDGVVITYRVLDEKKKTCEVKPDPNGYNTYAVDYGTQNLKIPYMANGYVVTGIAADAFSGMTDLEEVMLPSSLHNLGQSAFSYCENLHEVYIYRINPPRLLDGDGFPAEEQNAAFENIGIPAGSMEGWATLHVPSGSADAYALAPWTVWFGTIYDDITGESEAVQGDANGDGKVDVSDYIGVANHILGNTPEGFDEKAADVDHNNVIDVSDYIGVANIILTGSVTGNNARALGGETTGTDISGIDNVIYVKDFSDVKAGDEFELSFQMKNKAAIRGFQFDLYLPAGMEAVKTAKGKYQAAFNQSRLPEDDEHTMTLAEQSDGAIRILCGSQYDETFTGNDGELFTLKVKLSADMADGTHTISLKNQKLTETDITKFYETELVEAAMKVGSGAQTGTDISDMDNVIYVKDFTGVKAGDEFELPFSMKNLAAIRGFQFDLYLPTGMEAVKTAKGKYQATFNQSRLPEDDEHTLTVAEQSDGAIRILCGSQYDETFTGSDGELFTLKVKLSADMADGQYVITLKNQKLTETDITKFYETELVEGIMTLGEGSGINAVFADQKTGRIFDLQGRRVLTPGKGLYIRNGKKVVMK